MAVWHSDSFGAKSEDPDIRAHEEATRDWLRGLVAEKAYCSFCGDPLSYPMVTWVGSDFMAFHGPCAEQFGVRLIADAAKLRDNLIGPGNMRRESA